MQVSLIDIHDNNLTSDTHDDSFMSVFDNICTYVCVYVHIRTHKYIRTYTCMSDMYICICIHVVLMTTVSWVSYTIYIYVLYVCVYIREYMYIRTYKYMSYTYICICVYVALMTTVSCVS